MSKADKLFDAMVKTAMEEAVKQEMASLPSDKELNAAYPASGILDKKVMRIIARENRVQKRKSWRGAYVGIAASLALLFTVGTLAFINLNYVAPDESIGFAALEYAIPQAAPAPAGGFASRAQVLEDIEEAEFNFDVEDDSLWLYGMNDFANYTMYINDQEVFVFEMFEEGMSNSMTWHRDGVEFHIFGDKTIDELVDIVERFLE